MKQQYSLLAALLAAIPLTALEIPNASFEEGTTDAVPHWTVTSKTFCRLATDAAAHGKHAAIISGNGRNNNYWLSDVIPFKPRQTYRISYLGSKHPGSNGSLVTGPVFANVDRHLLKDSWDRQAQVFVVPENLSADNYRVRFGEWRASGTFLIDDIRLTPVQAVYHTAEGMTLGEGESVNINTYEFNAPFTGMGRNHSRPLAYTSTAFNTSRWVFGANSCVIYEHDLNARKQLSGQLAITVNYHKGGKLVVSVSKDCKTWLPVATIDRINTAQVKLPDSLFPAQKIHVKLEAAAAQKVGAKDSDPGSFQVNQYSYKATLDGSPTSLRGSTAYMEIENREPNLDITLLSASDCIPGKRNVLSARLKNTSGKPLTITPEATATRLYAGAQTAPCQIKGKPITLQPSATGQVIELPFDVNGTGTWSVNINLTDSSHVTFTATVPHYLDNSYGELLTRVPGTASLWSASSGWKIYPSRAVPTHSAQALQLSMAANEAEAAQLVITPEKDLQGVTLTASDMTSAQGNILPARNIDILQVYYHDVQVKTDATGMLGLWPDALPPHQKPVNLSKELNHPFWIRITAPKGTAPGTYVGTITIKDHHGWLERVNLKVTVFDFTLPDTMTCETAFGFYPGMIWQYHKPQTDQQRRLILHNYLTTLSKHHISPYNPAPLDNFSYKLTGLDRNNFLWTGRVHRDTSEKLNGKASLHLKDASTHAETAVKCTRKFKVNQPNATLSFAYKTAPGKTAMLTITHQDGNGAWMSGRNRDYRLQGTGKWERKTITLPTAPKHAKTYEITLRATQWAQDGRYTGETWFDDLRITQNPENSTVFHEDFEPIQQDINKLDIVFDWKRWDKAMHKAFEDYHFNTMRFYVAGLGGGTFHSRTEPSFCGFPEDTPEYKFLHKKFLGKIQDHLQEKGWLDRMFVYWFDEPDPKDYEFVMNGFRKLKEGAPKIRRMLTEQVEDDLIGGPNLWCPVTSSIDLTSIKPRQDAGEDFWWYVCTGPKAPYATLFIDHPGTEMRVWLWQTWKHNVKGILVWQTNQWTSPAAYPDRKNPQNPYLDPMSWVSGYSTPAGAKRPWGNGDGRFVYPPLSAADGKTDKPNLDAPVDCFRIEMLRDGIEDYEYFVILRKLIGENRKKLSEQQLDQYRKLLLVPENVTRTLTDFTLDPQTMEDHRQKLAKAIEALN